MGYFETTKSEMESLLRKVIEAQNKIAIEKNNLDMYRDSLLSTKNALDNLAKERQLGFPWLARAYEELDKLADENTQLYLEHKKNPAKKSSEIIKEETQRRRLAEKDLKIAKYIIDYYESIAPFLIDLREEVDIPNERDFSKSSVYSEEELKDEVTNYLTAEEYKKLSSLDRNQIALERYWNRNHTKCHVGKMYERYVGYLYEKDGYKVDYRGIFAGLEDLGRDLICSKGNEIIIIQCKNWSQFKTIFEKHIFQFFGTIFEYKDKNKDHRVIGKFVTSTKISDLAKRFSKELGIEVAENFKLDKNYPCIKCNISEKNGEKIYHLPFDQMYDKVLIEPEKGEFYCSTVNEAEKKGFRRALRHKPDKFSD